MGIHRCLLGAGNLQPNPMKTLPASLLPTTPNLRPAFEFAADAAMFDQMRGHCRNLLAGSGLDEAFPGFTADDLCHDVVKSLANCSCEGAGRFWRLFQIAAQRQKINMFRKSKTRKKHMDLHAGHHMPEDTETSADSHHSCAAQIAASAKSEDERVEAIAAEVEKMPMKVEMRPVLDAVVHEMRTGERITDKELSLQTGMKQNTICRMRERVRERAISFIGG